MVRVGIIGIGFMGRIHYLAYQKLRGVKVAAISTRDPAKLAGDWRKTTGNFGPAGEQFELGKIARHADYRELLADPSIDLVDICLPPAQHAKVAIAALRAGKHVLVEKPISLSTADAEKMVQAADEAKRTLCVAHVLPYFAEYAFALQAIRSGKYGRLLGAHFKRIISDPTWLKDFYDPKVVGGPLVDLHIHDAHFLRVACGMPESVFSRGRMRGEVVEFASTQFMFADPALQVTATSGVIPQQGRSFTHGFEIYLEKATLSYDFAVMGGEAVSTIPLCVFAQNGKVERPKLPAGDPIDPFAAEIRETLQAMKSGKPSTLLSGELARDALRLCQKQSQSVISGRAVRV